MRTFLNSSQSQESKSYVSHTHLWCNVLYLSCEEELCPCLILTDERPVRTDPMFQPVELPAGEPNLTAGLAEVDGDTFSGHPQVLSLSLGCRNDKLTEARLDSTTTINTTPPLPLQLDKKLSNIQTLSSLVTVTRPGSERLFGGR